jgi:glycosyltransferase involved in cell wall biosynthesis
MKAIMPNVDHELFEQILVLDGCSADGTIEWARDQGYEVHIQTKPGIRNAYNEVLPLIRGDVLITFSPDGNSVPELLPDLIKEMGKGRDMVIVSRYLDDAVSDDDDIITKFGNWLFTKTVNILHHANYTDVMVIYRAYITQLLYDLELNLDEGYVTPESLFRT